MKINLAFRGGASKGPAYIRFMKELDLKGGITGGTISGCSAGGITAAAVACGHTARSYYIALRNMPGERVMKWERKVEKGNFFQKIFYGPLVAIAARVSLSEKLLDYFEHYFSWGKVIPGVKLFIGFALQSELAEAYGMNRAFSFLDLYSVFKTQDPESLSKKVHIYFGSDDGVYRFDAQKKRLEKISADVIPLHKLIYSTMWNPIFNDIQLEINGIEHEPFDGGIADNWAGCAQTLPYISLGCIDKKEDYPSKSLSNFYRSRGPRPIKTVYCSPVVAGKAFFEFTDKQLKKEWEVQATNVLP